jgi:hypothetical protein
VRGARRLSGATGLAVSWAIGAACSQDTTPSSVGQTCNPESPPQYLYDIGGCVAGSVCINDVCRWACRSSADCGGSPCLLRFSGVYGGCQDFDAGSAEAGEAVMQDPAFPPTCAASCPNTCDPNAPTYLACLYCLEACVDVCESSPAACAASLASATNQGFVCDVSCPAFDAGLEDAD